MDASQPNDPEMRDMRLAFEDLAVSPNASTNHPAHVDMDSSSNKIASESPGCVLASLMHTLVHDSVVSCVRFSHDGSHLATGCNRTAQVYDASTGSKLSVLPHGSASITMINYVRAISFSPDGRCLVTGADDSRIYLWDVADSQICTVFNDHKKEVYSVEFSFDGQLIISGSEDGTVVIRSIHDGASRIISLNDIQTGVEGYLGVASVSASPDGKLVAAGCLDSSIYIWDVATMKLVARLQEHQDSVYCVAFMHDNKGLMSGSLDRTVKYWDVSGLTVMKEGSTLNRCIRTFIGHRDYVLTVAVTNDGRLIASGSKDRSVIMWDTHSGIIRCRLQDYNNSVISVDLSSRHHLLATGSGNWEARIWSYRRV